MSVNPGASRVGKVNQGRTIVNRGERTVEATRLRREHRSTGDTSNLRSTGFFSMESKPLHSLVFAPDTYLRFGSIWASVPPAKDEKWNHRKRQ
jgi:hypothetical protein